MYLVTFTKELRCFYWIRIYHHMMILNTSKMQQAINFHFTSALKSCGWYSSGRRKTWAHQNDIVWTLFDLSSTTFIHFWVILIWLRVTNLKSSLNDSALNLLLCCRSKWF
jgi:hypothetical protein